MSARDVIGAFIAQTAEEDFIISADADTVADAMLSALTAAGLVVVPRELLAELADDLAAYIAAHYGGSAGYPSMDRKRIRDMEPVNRARAMIAAAQEPGQ